MARPRNFDEAEVLDQAMEVFWRHGYDGASMAELTKAMGINSPSIYAAFGSKRGLFDAVLTRYRHRRTAHREWVSASRTAREVGERMLFGAIEWLVDPKEPRGCLLFQTGLSASADSEDVPVTLSKQRRGTREFIAGLLARLQEEEALSHEEDPAALARYLQMVFAGLAVQAGEGMSKTQLKQSATRALAGWPD